MKRQIPTQNKLILFFLFISLLVVTFAVWYGKNTSFQSEKYKTATETIAGLTFNLEEEANPQKKGKIYFNLGVAHYQDKNYGEAAQQFKSALNLSHGLELVEYKSFFNLGNTFFKMAGAPLPLEQKISMLKNSLNAYRGAMDVQERGGNGMGSGDPDLEYNMQLVKKYLKITKDQLNQRRSKEDSPKTVFQLLEEMTQIEKTLQKLLTKENNVGKIDLKWKDKKKALLLKYREESLRKLSLIKEKTMGATPQKRPPLLSVPQGSMI